MKKNKTHLVQTLWILIAIILPSPGFATDSATPVQSESQKTIADKQQLIQKVLSLSGVDEQIKEISHFAVSEIDNRKDALDEQEYARLRALFSSAFAVNRLKNTVLETYLAAYDETRFQEWSHKVQSPLMKQMFRLEEDVTATDQFSKIVQFAQNNKQHPPPKTRIKLVERLDQATRASELALDSQAAVLYLLLQAINPSLPDNQRLDQDKITMLAQSTRDQMKTVLVAVAEATYLYTYRDVSDKDLAEYVQVYESELGTWMISLSQSAIHHALQEAAHSINIAPGNLASLQN